MPDQNLNRQVNQGIAWIGLASSCVALLDVFALILILKYWITTEEFGIVTIVVTAFAALELVAELGISAAVIQKGDQSQVQLSTLFWINLSIGIVCALILFSLAPLFARYHDEQIITNLSRAMTLNLILRSCYSMFQAQLKRDLRLREISQVRICSNLLDFSTKIICALLGFGIWSFVMGHIARSLGFCIGLPLANKWRPSLTFKLSEVTSSLSFGIKNAASEIIYQLYTNIDYQLIGVFFGKEVVGLYRAAYEIVFEPVKFLSGVVVAVAFPAFSKLKNRSNDLKKQFNSFCKQNLLAVLFCLIPIFVMADDVLVVMINSEYQIPLLVTRCLAVIGFLRVLSHLGPPLLDGLGHPLKTFQYQLFAAIAVCSAQFISIKMWGNSLGYQSIAIAWVIGYPLAFVFLFCLVWKTARINIIETLYSERLLIAAYLLSGASIWICKASMASSAPLFRLTFSLGVFLITSILSLIFVAKINYKKIRHSLH